MEPTPEQLERLETVRGFAVLGWRTDPVLVPSDANDAWLVRDRVYGDVVLRIGWRGDRGRLVTEARVGRALPAAVGYPRVLGFGWTRDEADLTWSVTRRLAGTTLADAWDGLRGAQRDRALAATARLVGALHRWRPSGALSDRLLAGPRGTDPGTVAGSSLLPLPPARTRRLLGAADRLAGDAPEVLRQAVAWLGARAHLAPPVDLPHLPVTHQDLHPGHVWWDGREVRALLDLEWARHAAPWAELGRLADEDDEPADRLRVALVEAVDGMAVPDLAARVHWCRTAYALRRLVVSAGSASAGSTSTGSVDAVAALRRLLAGPG